VNLLLDTHVLLWALTDDPRLKPAARRAIVDPANVVYVSATSALELAIKSALGKVHLPASPAQWLPAEIERSEFTELPISVSHALAVGNLPRHHDDPFDRLLVAQARAEKLTLVTADPAIHRYDVSVLRA
jgi:PIN domain nuclease of toxin-antitoxin system